MFYKPEIREKIQRRRRRLDAINQAQAGQRVAAQLVYLKEFLDAQHIGSYLPIEGELDTLPLMHCGQTLKKQFYLPIIPSKESSKLQPLQFFPYRMGDVLIKDSHGISEPDPKALQPISLQNLDVIFLPVVAFDINGNRLGRGAGYYDRTLAFVNERIEQGTHTKPCLIGLAYEFQKIEQIITDKWDVALDIIVTEDNIYYRNTH